MRARPTLLVLLVATGMSPAALTQETRPATTTRPESRPTLTSSITTEALGDEMIMFFTLPRFTRGDMVIRGDRGALVLDREDYVALFGSGRTVKGLPRRGPIPADPRTVYPVLLMQQRLAQLRTGGKPDTQATDSERLGDYLEAARAVYVEGSVLLEVAGHRFARAERVYLSPADDRLVVEDAELVLVSNPGTPDAYPLTIRCQRAVQQGDRIVARDAFLTTCEAAMPHYQIHCGLVEVVRQGGQFEVRTVQNSLELGDWFRLPVPDVSFHPGDESPLPFQGARIGHSDSRGYFVDTRWGSNWNALGGSIHEALTGRPREEFRGGWTLGLGASKDRGYPMDLELRYKAADLYAGRTEFFFLDDPGRDRREIQSYLDGQPIDEDTRTVLLSENRIHLDENTRLDLQAFTAGDPAAYPEFYPNHYKIEEVKETSAHVRHATGNRLATVTGRFNLDDFSYTDRGTLSPSFVTERPLATFDWVGEPLLDLAHDLPLLLTSSTSAGYLRKKFDDHVAPGDPGRPYVREAAARLDHEFELAAPFSVGPVGVRPFASARYTAYSDSPASGSIDRFAYAAGIRAGTRVERVFDIRSEALNLDRVRHVVSPEVEVRNVFQVSRDPSELFQFDRTDAIGEVDSLEEGAAVRMVLLNRFQTRRPSREEGRGGRRIEDFLWLDLAQTVFPLADRDNAGDPLGLFEFELIYKPDAPLLPIPGLRFLFEGEWDWNDDAYRTNNVGTAFDPFPRTTCVVEWRRGADGDGTIDGTISARVAGRWELGANGQYDFDRDTTLAYGLGLARHDHDWILRFSVSFDEIGEDRTFSIRFEPRIGGIHRAPRGRYLAGDPEFGGLHERF